MVARTKKERRATGEILLTTGNPERVAYDSFQYLHTLVRVHDLLEQPQQLAAVHIETQEDFDVHAADGGVDFSVDYVQVKFRQDESPPWSLTDEGFRDWVARSAVRFAG